MIVYTVHEYTVCTSETNLLCEAHTIENVLGLWALT